MGATSRIEIIELLRALAAVSVALFHFSGQMTSAVPSVFHAYGWLGVDVFFVISGFVIPLSLLGRGYSASQFPKFMVRRIIRLEPAYLASIALVIGLWHMSALAPAFRGGEPEYSFWEILAHVFYLIPFSDWGWLNPVYWTLAYELAFYIVVGLTFSTLIGRPVAYTVAVAAFAIGVSYYFTREVDVRIAEFSLGAVLTRFVFVDENDFGVGCWLFAIILFVFWFGEFGMGLACVATLAAIGFLRRERIGDWAVFAGSFSYSLYLTHVPVGGRVINLGRRFGDGALYECGLIVVAMVVSLAFAIVFARIFEFPAVRMSRQLRLGSRRVASKI